ncbi:unnamed protein product [Moneuplotes crassus]|uniref:Uncharacterized protein n=1 Tax=Euplotes crassus TaxID=5936 RepID=A0AAD1UCM3_EUPCR|nr:unnamed protein product [Moneuplotes crassus]
MCLPFSLKDIWSDDLVSCEGSDECSPQIPKVTHQFENTLRDNKGKPHNKDLYWKVKTPSNNKLDGPLDGGVHQGSFLLGPTALEICTSRHKKTKAKTYTFSPSRRYLDKKQVKLLRKIPSSDILQMLLT